eukprot:311957-Chlamydomonas_euryale.AAC.10
MGNWDPARGHEMRCHHESKDTLVWEVLISVPWQAKYKYKYAIVRHVDGEVKVWMGRACVGRLVWNGLEGMAVVRHVDGEVKVSMERACVGQLVWNGSEGVAVVRHVDGEVKVQRGAQLWAGVEYLGPCFGTEVGQSGLATACAHSSATPRSGTPWPD